MPGFPHQPSHQQAAPDEASHEPDLQAEVVSPSGLSIRHQQESVGHDANQGERDEGEPYAAGALPRAHGQVSARASAE